MLTRTSIKRTEKFEASLGSSKLTTRRSGPGPEAILDWVKKFRAAEKSFDLLRPESPINYDLLDSMREDRDGIAVALVHTLIRALDKGSIILQDAQKKS